MKNTESIEPTETNSLPVVAESNQVAGEPPDWYSSTVQTLKDLFTDLEGKMQEIGNFIAEALDHNPRVREMWLKDLPHLTPGMIDGFERIGRRQMRPEIYLCQSSAADKLMFAPMSVQNDVVQRGVPVVEKEGTRITVTYKKLADLTPKEAKRAIKDGGLRSIEEQVEILTPAPERKPLPDWEPDEETGDIIVHRSVRITFQAYSAVADKFYRKQTKEMAEEVNTKKGRAKA